MPGPFSEHEMQSHMLRISGNRRVPALVHADFVHYQSIFSVVLCSMKLGWKSLITPKKDALFIKTTFIGIPSGVMGKRDVLVQLIGKTSFIMCMHSFAFVDSMFRIAFKNLII